MAFAFRPVVIRRKNGRKTRQRSAYYWASYRDPVDGTEKRV